MAPIEFKEQFGPGKCSKCGVYIEDDVHMYVAVNLSGRPSMIKDPLVLVSPSLLEKCLEKLNA